MRTLLASLVLAMPVALTSGCLVDPADEQQCHLMEPDEIDQTAPRYQFVIDSIDFPDTPAETSLYGLNLDGDERSYPDNALGQIFSTIRDFLDIDMDSTVQPGIDDAQLLHLVEVQATSLDSAEGVGVNVFLGSDLDDDPADNFTGYEPFSVAGASGEPLSGFIADGRLEADLGTVPLRLAVPRVDGTLVLHLNVARIDAEITEDGIHGVLAGVLSEEEMDDTLFPAIHASVSAIVERDCLEGECYPDSSGESLLDRFDDDHDGTIGLAELRENLLIGALFAPDIDMLDADNEVRPRCDGARESYSVGLAFTAVPAQF